MHDPIATKPAPPARSDMTDVEAPAAHPLRKRIALIAVVIVILGIIGLPLVMVLSARVRSRNEVSTMTREPGTSAPSSAEVSTPSPTQGDERITRITQLVGKSKEDVVQTLGPPTDFLYINGTYTYNLGELQAFMRFFDPEREQSNFNSQTRGAAATLAALSLRFNAAARGLSLPAVLRSIGAPGQPAYLLIDRNAISYLLLTRGAPREFHVGVGGVQEAGFAYEVLARCAEPPLAGQESFNYETNRQDITGLIPNSNFRWESCTPLGVRMNARNDWQGYALSFYDDSLGAHGLHERIALDGTPLPETTP
jgi:hypothetical protein